MKIRHPYLSPLAHLLTGVALAVTSAAHAADIYWNAPQASTSMVNNANYTGNVAPGANDTAIYSTDYVAANGNPLTANKSLNPVNTNKPLGSITFDYGTNGVFSWGIGTTQQGSLLLTAGGTIQTIGNQSANFTTTLGRAMTIQGNYTFKADAVGTGGTSNINVAGVVTPAASLGNITLTLSGQSFSTGSGVGTLLNTGVGGTITNALGSASGTTIAISKEGAGTWQMNGANTFSGGVAVKQGTLVAGNSAAFGSGNITLGNNSVGQNAAILLGSNVNISNAISVESGAGTRILGTNAQSGPTTFSGGITLANNLRLQNQSASRLLNVTGGITGTGDVEVYINNPTGSGGGVVLSGNSVNNVGTFSNISPGTNPLTQDTGGIIGANVTEFIQNSSTSTTTLSLANEYGTTSVLAGTLETTGTGTLGLGDVTVDGGSLLLGSSISLSDTATLMFIESALPTITLNNAMADTVYSVFNITSGTWMDVGTWDATALNSFFGTNVFAGSGSLTVVAVPEPSAYALGVLGFLGVVMAMRRRRRLS